MGDPEPSRREIGSVVTPDDVIEDAIGRDQDEITLRGPQGGLRLGAVTQTTYCIDRVTGETVVGGIGLAFMNRNPQPQSGCVSGMAVVPVQSLSELPPKRDNHIRLIDSGRQQGEFSVSLRLRKP